MGGEDRRPGGGVRKRHLSNLTLYMTVCQLIELIPLKCPRCFFFNSVYIFVYNLSVSVSISKSLLEMFINQSSVLTPYILLIPFSNCDSNLLSSHHPRCYLPCPGPIIHTLFSIPLPE